MKLFRISTVSVTLNTFCKDLLKDLSRNGYEIVAISSPDKVLDELPDREGIRAIGVQMERHISPLKDLKSLWKSGMLCRKKKLILCNQ